LLAPAWRKLPLFPALQKLMFGYFYF